MKISVTVRLGSQLRWLNKLVTILHWTHSAHLARSCRFGGCQIWGRNANNIAQLPLLKCFKVVFLSHLWSLLSGDHSEPGEQTSDIVSYSLMMLVQARNIRAPWWSLLAEFNTDWGEHSLLSLQISRRCPSVLIDEGSRTRTKEPEECNYNRLCLILRMKWTYMHEHSSCQEVFKYVLLARFSLFLNLALLHGYPSAGSNQTDNWRQPSNTALPGPSVF